MDDILKTLNKEDAIDPSDLKALVDAILEEPKTVTSYIHPDEGGTFLHLLTTLPSARQEEVLPLFYLAVNKGVDVNAKDSQVRPSLHLVCPGITYYGKIY